MLVVRAARTPGAASCSTPMSPRSAVTPTATSSSTTSPCPAATPRSSRWPTGTRCATSARSTAPTSTTSGSTTRRCITGDELQIGKFKLVFLGRTRRGLRPATAGTPVPPSIGEVLALLRDEFPDITISKIRFLESQGLVDPERTPSGYRKFYDDDVERLRWILRPAEGALPAAQGHQGPARPSCPRVTKRSCSDPRPRPAARRNRPSSRPLPLPDPRPSAVGRRPAAPLRSCPRSRSTTTPTKPPVGCDRR